jgi:hypothetical protein
MEFVSCRWVFCGVNENTSIGPETPENVVRDDWMHQQKLGMHRLGASSLTGVCFLDNERQHG